MAKKSDKGQNPMKQFNKAYLEYLEAISSTNTEAIRAFVKAAKAAWDDMDPDDVDLDMLANIGYQVLAVCAVARTPAGGAPTHLFGGAPASPFVAAPASPFVAAPASPFVAAPASPFVAAPASPFVAAPASPFVAAPASPFVAVSDEGND